MSLADHLESAAQTAPLIQRDHHAPTGWEPGVRYDATSGLPTEVTTGQVPGEQLPEGQWADLVSHLLPMVPAGYVVRLVEARYDPVAWTRGAQGDQATTREAWRYRFRIVPAEAIAHTSADLAAALISNARRSRPRLPKAPSAERTRVVVVSDLQIGKTDHRGGTPALLERLSGVLDQLDDLMRTERCADAVILDPGDLTEGFENTAQQQHTNDLAFPDQLDAAQAFLQQIVETVGKRHAQTRVATVPSNHGAWRKGKDRLGRPGDDFGVMTHKAVARTMATAGRDDLAFVIPDPWSEALAVQVRGAVVGMAHGHQANRPDGIPDWWARQTHGGGPLAAASILITGHFHHLRVQPTGSIDGRDRWWFQAPTLDNGSAWFRNGSGGSDSEAGLLTFTIGDDGRWDDLHLLTHNAPPSYRPAQAKEHER